MGIDIRPLIISLVCLAVLTPVVAMILRASISICNRRRFEPIRMPSYEKAAVCGFSFVFTNAILMALIWTGQSRLGEATFPAPKGTVVREGGRLVTSDGQPSLVHSLCVDPILKWTVFTLASGFGCILVGGGIAARLFEVEVRDGFKIGAWTTGLLAGIAILPIFLAVTIGLVAL